MGDERAKRIAASRAALAKRYAEDPESVERFNLRIARIEAVRKRERDRVAALVWGPAEPDPPNLDRPPNMNRMEWKAERKRRLDAHRASVAKWQKERQPAPIGKPTPEQMAHAPYAEKEVSDYVGGRLVKLGRAYTRQSRFETIQGLSAQQLAALRQYRRAFDCSEMSPVKSALDIGSRSGGGGSDAALQRLEVMAFADIMVVSLQEKVPAHLLPTLRAVALHDKDFKEVALERFGSASGQRRARVRSDFVLAVDALLSPRTAAVLDDGEPAEAPTAPPSPQVNPAFFDENGLMLPAQEIARIIVESLGGQTDKAA